MKKDLEKYNLSNSDIAYLIDQWIRGARNRTIMRDRLLNGLTYERLAEKHDLSVRQTKTIVYKGINTLIKYI